MIFSSFDRRDYLFLKMKIKGSVAGSIGAVFQKPDGFAGRGDFPSIPITTEMGRGYCIYQLHGRCGLLVFFLIMGSMPVPSILMICLYIAEVGNTIPLTPEEKEEILTNELERWIKGNVGILRWLCEGMGCRE